MCEKDEDVRESCKCEHWQCMRHYHWLGLVQRSVLTRPKYSYQMSWTPAAAALPATRAPLWATARPCDICGWCAANDAPLQFNCNVCGLNMCFPHTREHTCEAIVECEERVQIVSALECGWCEKQVL
mgnify:FL=1